MIIVAGEKLYPTEVENARTKHPAVAEAAAVGIPDENFGKAVRAFAALRPGRRAGRVTCCRSSAASCPKPSDATATGKSLRGKDRE